MYYRHNLDYTYPDKCDGHMLKVKHLRDVNLDENYPYLPKGFWFRCQRVLLRALQNTLLPLVVWLAYGIRVHDRKKVKSYKELFKEGLITISNHVMFMDYATLLVVLRPHIGYFPVWKTNLEGSNKTWIRMSGGIPVPTDNHRSMAKFMGAIEEVLEKKEWLHFFPEGSMWYYYPDIRPLKKAVFKYAVSYDRPILPITFSFRPRTGLWKLIGKTPLVDVNIGDPIYRDKSLPKLEAVKKMQQDAYHIMQVMNGINPGDPTYNTDLNLENYRKTM